MRFMAIVKLWVFFSLGFFVLSISGSDLHENNDDTNENTFQLQQATLSDEGWNLLSMLSNVHERNFVAELLIKLLVSYSILILKFICFFDENVLYEQYKRLKVLLFHLEAHSTYINKSNHVSTERLFVLYSQCLDFLSSDNIVRLNAESTQDANKFIVNVANNYDELLGPVKEALVLIECISSLELDPTLSSLTLIIISFILELINMLECSVKKFKSLNKANFQKLFESRKNLIDKIDVSMRISSQRLENYQESVDNYRKNRHRIEEYKKFLEGSSCELDSKDIETTKQLFESYYNNNDCTELQVFEMEALVLISIEMLGLIGLNVLYFDSMRIRKFSETIEGLRIKANEETQRRGTEASVSEEDALNIREAVMEKLGYDQIVSLDIISSKFREKLDSKVILSNIKGLYLLLIKMLQLLKRELQLNKCGAYIQNLLELTINVFDSISRECLFSIKSYEKSENIEIIPLETIRTEREATVQKLKEILSSQIEKTKEKIKIEEEKAQQLELEKKLELEETKMELSKKKEERKGKRRPKARSYPEMKEVGIAAPDEKKEPEKPSSQETKATVRNKAERKKKLLEKISKSEEKCLLNEKIRETVQKEKSSRKSQKKRKQEERRRARGMLGEQDQDRVDEEQGVGEADNESQTEYDDSKEDSDNQKCSVKAIEKKDGKSDLEKLIIPVLKIVEETISHDALKQDEAHGEKYEEKSKGACSESYSTRSTGKKRRAYEVPTGAPLVQNTASLFGEDAKFETRRSGKTRDSSSERSKCSYMGHRKPHKSLDSARSLESDSGSSGSTDIHTPRHRVRTICKSSSRKSRSRSRNRDGSSKRATSAKRSRSLSIPRTKSRPSIRTRSNSLPRARSRHGSNTNSDTRSGTSSKGDSMTNLVNKFIQLEKDVSELYSGPQEVQSRFIPMFSKSKSSDSLQNFDIFSFFSIHTQDFSHINENSSLEEIENSIESCGMEITRIHLEIIPLLSGYDLLTLKIFLKDLISQFIKLLILMNNKKREAS